MARPAREIPWLDQRENGTYYVYWYDKESRQTNRFSLGTKNPNEAKAAYITFLADGKDIVRPRAADLTVSQALSDYEMEHVNEKCADAARQRVIIGHLKAHFGDAPLRAVDIDASRMYRDARLSGETGGGKRRKPAPASLSTVRRELVVLTAAANHARKRKRLKRDDMPEVELPPDSKIKAEWYREKELKLAIDTATGKLKKFLRILYYTGARRRAIENLGRSQVDFDARQIDLFQSGDRRTKKHKPIVPLFSEIEQDLRDLVAEAEDEGREALFGKDMYRDYSSHFEAIGLDHKANPHLMRHTRVTHMLRAGVSTWKVAKLIGDSEETVVRVYGHHIPQDLAQYGGDV